jgi:hypothetical protein
MSEQKIEAFWRYAKAEQVSVWVASADRPTLWVCGCGEYVIMPMERK